VLAFVLLRTCGIGRASAVGSPGAKLLSLVLVTAGLVICSLDDGAAPTIPTSAAGGGIAGAPRVHLSASPILRPVNDSSSAFYSSYHFAPVLHSLRGGNAYGRPWRRHPSSRRRKARKARQGYFFPTAETPQ